MPTEARAAVGPVLEMAPLSPRSHGVAGLVDLYAGDYRSSVPHFEQALKRAGHPVGPLVPLAFSRLYSDYATLLGYAHLKLGDDIRIGGNSVLHKDLLEAGDYVGFPLMEKRRFGRHLRALRGLVELAARKREG